MRNHGSRRLRAGFEPDTERFMSSFANLFQGGPEVPSHGDGEINRSPLIATAQNRRGFAITAIYIDGRAEFFALPVFPIDPPSALSIFE
jgi:hypothetical protein